ncbi:MAG: 16S rRNA (adenine(1518)-N(6)/adenine(1519)-N(6))-dimethyltransferase RsmA [Betaproteobacteria bacterium]|nr:16S rRNA (adenine(1518)-N(6)/adenine(1519)-N(6))-dimethyltransferase RsmA [Betaproteobacteria bacterium]
MPSSSRAGTARTHVARKRFGQHFLHDPHALARMVEAIAPSPKDFVIEIGPGEGALTRLLLERLERLQAIELDRDLVQLLGKAFPRERLQIHSADALGFDFGGLPVGARIVGNLPYNISTPLLFHLSRWVERFRDLHFLLQKEVVERMVAQPSTPAYGRLSVSLQSRFTMKRLFDIGPGAFRPPPKVESSFVRMQPIPSPLEIDEDVLRRAFSARRKTLRNALPGVDWPSLGIDSGLRPENLSARDYARISASLRRGG